MYPASGVLYTSFMHFDWPAIHAIGNVKNFFVEAQVITRRMAKANWNGFCFIFATVEASPSLTVRVCPIAILRAT